MESVCKELGLYLILPFAAWLLTIALTPLLAPHFWEKNWRKAVLGLLFALPILGYYGWKGCQEDLLYTAKDYFSFITLLASLFVVSGGILLKGDIEAKPSTNALFLLIGGVLANLVGTTGASMVLIRPLLRINSERTRTWHIPIFFIFIVSNIGGCLTPLGDPPLFLGYLKGVPFTWTFRLFPLWATALALILTVFYIYDSIQYRREPPSALIRDETQLEPITVSGTFNFLLLLGIMAAVLFNVPTPWRELIMIAMATVSYAFTPLELRKRNGFTFHPIVEVAVLFAAIFITMIPALSILRERGGELGITRPWQFFWLTGGLSSFLDNAPTYLTYLSLAQGVTQGLSLPAQIVGVPAIYLQAISAGAVFMGANTYIGNAPNFMVKSISEAAGYKMPSFFSYMVYSALILFPLFAIITLIFFTGAVP
jgi:Na+/H+ antiporter NhaD/arsenite permease-like protein